MTMMKRILKFVAFVFCVAALIFMAGYMFFEVGIVIINRIILNSIILTALLTSILHLMDMFLFEKRFNVREETLWFMSLSFTLAVTLQTITVTSMPFFAKIGSAIAVLVVVAHFWEIDQMLIKQKRKE